MKTLAAVDTLHPNLVHLVGVLETADYIYVIMEVVDGGELFDNIVENGAYTEAEAKIVMRSLLSALSFLHSHRVVHRDLKPENILCKTRLEIKLADFGLSNVLPDVGADAKLQSRCGTPVYMAPEMLQHRPYNESVDVWSAGIIMYILMSGSLPFYAENPTEFLEIVLTSEFEFPDDEWGEVSETAKDLIREILVTDPAQRPTIEDIMENPWFAD